MRHFIVLTKAHGERVGRPVEMVRSVEEGEDGVTVMYADGRGWVVREPFEEVMRLLGWAPDQHKPRVVPYAPESTGDDALLVTDPYYVPEEPEPRAQGQGLIEGHEFTPLNKCLNNANNCGHVEDNFCCLRPRSEHARKGEG